MSVLPLLSVPNFSHARTPVQQFIELYVQGLIERLVPLTGIYDIQLVIQNIHNMNRRLYYTSYYVTKYNAKYHSYNHNI